MDRQVRLDCSVNKTVLAACHGLVLQNGSSNALHAISLTFADWGAACKTQQSIRSLYSASVCIGSASSLVSTVYCTGSVTSGTT